MQMEVERGMEGTTWQRTEEEVEEDEFNRIRHMINNKKELHRNRVNESFPMDK